jgi:hypothetical protein
MFSMEYISVQLSLMSRGVIDSLIFVGGELRQNAIATRAATNAEVSLAFVAFCLIISQLRCVL